VVKLVYYFGWVGDSFAVYFKDLKDEEVSLSIYRSALGIFVPFHILDSIRQVVMIVLLVSMHLKFRREAREARLRIEAGEPSQNQLARTHIEFFLRDVRAFYLARELGTRVNERYMRRKQFAVVRPGSLSEKREGERSENVCPICCEEMLEKAVQLSCDPRHLFHEGCIQMWVTKHTNCPLCKLEVI